MNNQLRDFKGMGYVTAHYTESKMSDSDFAARMSKELGILYSRSRVTNYRKVLEIENNIVQTPSEMVLRLKEAEEIIKEMTETLELPESLARRAMAFLGVEEY